ncbi:hypothetical protein EV207_11315 [Scopulibacillus darangshiensis]|uniref:Uncharacterized protein n=1 Tax=Scopulibacillus darangshiensis TaxID=442528 RepID=A0A4R2P2X2_9BACL|nr:hypothetical protein [Scopulibacillus darangshiensis]TCP28982.1 hypothetical protein EV207_11315 [Scopulibacillus darangshiensis]
MRYNEIDLRKLLKKEFETLSLKEQIEVNILNFIRTIHVNHQDFYTSSFDSKYHGDLEMAFKKDADRVIGHCRILVKNDDITLDYLFTENGFELLEDTIKG